LGGCLRYGEIHFPLADVFYLGGHLRLVQCCIQVNMMYSPLLLNYSVVT